jgi:hypothetical protein
MSVFLYFRNLRHSSRWIRTDWKPFPDPTKGDFIVAPFGPGCYELRLMGSGQLVLFASAGHVAYRMCSLHPSGAGTRNNSKKREYVEADLPQIEYRVIAFASRDEARDFERRELLSRHPFATSWNSILSLPYRHANRIVALLRCQIASRLPIAWRSYRWRIVIVFLPLPAV